MKKNLLILILGSTLFVKIALAANDNKTALDMEATKTIISKILKEQPTQVISEALLKKSLADLERPIAFGGKSTSPDIPYKGEAWEISPRDGFIEAVNRYLQEFENGSQFITVTILMTKKDSKLISFDVKLEPSIRSEGLGSDSLAPSSSILIQDKKTR